MRVLALTLAGLIGATACADGAEAATVYFYVDAMTLEQRSVRVDPTGPDRAYLCILPPATAGCQEVPLKRKRR